MQRYCIWLVASLGCWALNEFVHCSTHSAWLWCWQLPSAAVAVPRLYSLRFSLFALCLALHLTVVTISRHCLQFGINLIALYIMIIATTNSCLQVWHSNCLPDRDANTHTQTQSKTQPNWNKVCPRRRRSLKPNDTQGKHSLRRHRGKDYYCWARHKVDGSIVYGDGRTGRKCQKIYCDIFIVMQRTFRVCV